MDASEQRSQSYQKHHKMRRVTNQQPLQRMASKETGIISTSHETAQLTLYEKYTAQLTLYEKYTS